MSPALNPAAPHDLPVFITPPGEPDVFLYGCAIFLVLAVFGLGTVYFRLHALPEHMAHGNASKLQFEVVAVLALLALFTHTTAFWIAALLLALVPIPDFHGPINAIADSLARMAGVRREPADTDTVDTAPQPDKPLPDEGTANNPSQPRPIEPIGEAPVRSL